MSKQQPSKNFMDGRPQKVVFSDVKQKVILEKIKLWVASNLPPNTVLYKQRIFGSLAKGTFGKYKTEFKGRIYSDVDILFVVDDDFSPPNNWKVQFECVKDVWIVYDVAIAPITIDDEVIQIEIQFIVLKKTFADKKSTIKEAEKWGIPLKKSISINKFISLD